MRKINWKAVAREKSQKGFERGSNKEVTRNYSNSNKSIYIIFKV